MPVSLSTAERANPPPRRKSCLACIKAKRRCDARRPSCLRCCQRNIPCNYPSTSLGTTYMAPPPQTISPSLLELTDPDFFTSPELAALLAEPLEPPESLVPTEPPPQPEHLPVLLPDTLNPDVISLLHHANEHNVDELLPCVMFHLTEDNHPPAATTTIPTIRDTTPTIPIASSTTTSSSFNSSTSLIPRTPAHLAAPRTARFHHVANVIAFRLQYAIDRLQEAPRLAVAAAATPWQHRALYAARTPRSLQDALGACALHGAKNRVNAPFVMRMVECRADDILAAPPPPADDRLEALARVHALLLLQIVRVFDGDIAARAAAERAIGALEGAAMALLPFIDFQEPEGVLSLYPLEDTRSFWLEWVFMESARRTYLIVFFFTQLFRLFLGIPPMCDGKMFLAHGWTLSAHLWSAEDAVDFAIAWREKRHFMVTHSDFMGVLRDARADDVEVFGKILLTALLGHDETKGWLASRGGTL
jgi:hypothetical protein